MNFSMAFPSFGSGFPVQFLQQFFHALAAVRAAAEAHGTAQGHIAHHGQSHVLGYRFFCCLLGVLPGLLVAEDLHGFLHEFPHNRRSLRIRHDVHEDAVLRIVTWQFHGGFHRHFRLQRQAAAGVAGFNGEYAGLHMPVMDLLVPVGKRPFIQREGDLLAFAGCQRGFREALQFPHRAQGRTLRIADIKLDHRLAGAVPGIPDRQLHGQEIRIFDLFRAELQVAVFEGGIGQAEAEGEQHIHLFLVIIL